MQKHPVRTYPAYKDGTMGEGEIVGEASSKTEAIQLVRAAGYQVLLRGGLVELHELAGEPAEWWVTVHGEESVTAAAARALRAIPSERRAAASRANGRKGGRPRHLPCPRCKRIVYQVMTHTGAPILRDKETGRLHQCE